MSDLQHACILKLSKVKVWNTTNTCSNTLVKWQKFAHWKTQVWCAKMYHHFCSVGKKYVQASCRFYLHCRASTPVNSFYVFLGWAWARSALIVTMAPTHGLTIFICNYVNYHLNFKIQTSVNVIVIIVQEKLVGCIIYPTFVALKFPKSMYVWMLCIYIPVYWRAHVHDPQLHLSEREQQGQQELLVSAMKIIDEDR